MKLALMVLIQWQATGLVIYDYSDTGWLAGRGLFMLSNEAYRHSCSSTWDCYTHAQAHGIATLMLKHMGLLHS